jgi:transposase
MQKRKVVTNSERAQVVALHNVGLSVKQICGELGLSQTTVRRVIKRFETEGSTERKFAHSHPTKMTVRDERRLIFLAQTNRFASLNQLKTMWGGPLQINRMRFYLQKHGFGNRLAVKKPQLSKVNQKRRLDFCKQFQHYEVEDWENFIFSDECQVEDTARRRVWRRPHEKLKPDCILETKKWDQKIMVWGCFSKRKLGPIAICKDHKVTVGGGIKGQDYLKILNDVAVPFFSDMAQFGPVTFQQDNAPIHKIKQVCLRFQTQICFSEISAFLSRSENC